MVDFPFISVLVCTILAMVLGGLWYSPVMFGKRWMNALGITLNDIEQGGKSFTAAYLASTAGAVVTASCLAVLFAALNLTSIIGGIMVATALYFGLNFTSFFKLIFWEDRPVSLTLIDAGYDLSCFVMMGGILAYWR